MLNEEIGSEEVVKVIIRSKRGKDLGMDGIVSEVIKYGGLNTEGNREIIQENGWKEISSQYIR